MSQLYREDGAAMSQLYREDGTAMSQLYREDVRTAMREEEMGLVRFKYNVTFPKKKSKEVQLDC